MHVPKTLWKQMKAYEAQGFHVVSLEHREGSHWCARFREFPQPQFITQNAHDPRALKNNIARFKRLMRTHEKSD